MRNLFDLVVFFALRRVRVHTRNGGPTVDSSTGANLSREARKLFQREPVS